jgi:hypothetical protein
MGCETEWKLADGQKYTEHQKGHKLVEPWDNRGTIAVVYHDHLTLESLLPDRRKSLEKLRVPIISGDNNRSGHSSITPRP